ncbi:MAG: hypothetical protein GY806_01765 [Gammaproteobacteria bacterium]|nr:hypothetical protein [Gammaproteobacteria bacterium]
MELSFRRYYLFFQAFVALLQAWNIKTRSKISYVQFTPSNQLNKLSQTDIDYLAKCADFLVRYGAIRTGRKCFFRAYILGSVLRKWGIPVILNVGLYNLIGDCKRRGHCWLTLNGHIFADSSTKVDIYKTRLGSGSNGICYWYGDLKTPSSNIYC